MAGYICIMSEKGIQEGIQTVIQGMDEFAYSDVTINDWTVLDESGSKAPYIIIHESGQFISRQGAKSANTEWDISAWLYYYLADKSWKDAMNGFRDTRQAILDEFNAVGTARSAGGLEGTSVDEIRAGTEIEFEFHRDVDPAIDTNAQPIFAIQEIVFSVREF